MKLFKKIFSMAATAIVLACVVACGKNPAKGKVTVEFLFGGDISQIKAYAALTKEYNETQGEKDKIYIKTVSKPGEIDTVISQKLPTKSSPDIVAVQDQYFKKNTVLLEDLTGKFSDEIINGYYPNTISRYRYNREDNTSNEDDPLFGLPLYNDATVLYYNRAALEQAGVKCISVDKEDLKAFNEEGAKDLKGKTKADYGITLNVPAKGYFRSETPYIKEEGSNNGANWSLPTDSEVLVFNDRIPMNWDEVDDISMLCTTSHNPKSPTQYGFYTEWWFNYGWSVGGDCVVDMTGEGDWTYSLPCNLLNYIVQPGKTYTGLYSGKVYQAGETLSVPDTLDAKKGDTISYNSQNNSTFYFTVNGEETAERDFSSDIESGVLAELPSIQTAFSRFCFLACKGGLNVSPFPSEFSTTSSATYFSSKKLAFLLELFSESEGIQKKLGNDWGIAPLLQYKEYTDPTDPMCDTVKVEGKMASHSFGFAVSVSKMSKVKDESIKVIEWLATEGQKFLAENGYVSARAADYDANIEKFPYTNAKIVVDSMSQSRAGDWWYMPDRLWINTWADPLNKIVRYGNMPFEKFIYANIESTNKSIANYKK